MEDERRSITFAPVGTIHTPFTDPAGMPIQPPGGAGVRGTVLVHEAYAGGLKDIGGFSHLILIYAFHRSRGFSCELVPFLDTVSRGVFSTRAPRRPNPIGVSVVRLIGISGSELSIEDVDILDGTPLLDIKPYIPAFDCFPDASAGWLESALNDVAITRSDRRFADTVSRHRE